MFVHHFKFPSSRNSPGAGQQKRNLKVSQSSSDVYALNSEGGGEFYGVVGPRLKQLAAANCSRFQRPADGRLAKFAATSSSSCSSSSNSAGAGAGASAKQSALDKSTNALQANRLVRVFNMVNFKEALEFESRQPVPNRIRLQGMCMLILGFVCDEPKLLNLPSWIMIINMVALDLLSSVIGLVSPRELGEPGNAFESLAAPMSGYRRRASESRLDRMARSKSFEDAEGYDQCDFEAPDNNDDEPYRKLNGLSGGNKSRLNHNNNSKSDQRPMARAKRQAADDSYFRLGNSDDSSQYYAGARQALVKTTKSEGELKNLAAEAGSSSSGFNSNCSFQNESSLATSSSSINAAADLKNRKSSSKAPTSEKKVSKFKRLFQGSEGSNKPSPTNPEVSAAGKLGASSRGKRLPKMADSLGSAVGDDEAIMSAPIAIPAPPTSAGNPSGKANLILVSPTGLSPPTAKRASSGERAFLSQGELLLPREFHTIKHIDEAGRCNVLLDRSLNEQAESVAPAKLPSGIPAHAQLAPPATQRHILRYLMSTATGVDSPKPRPPPPPARSQESQKFANLSPVAPAAASQRRPLPVLPPNRPKRQQRKMFGLQRAAAKLPMRTTNEPVGTDESLYYSGLQARVPKHQQQRALPVHPISKGAIEAILSDVKQSAHFRKQQQKLNQCHYDQLLAARTRSNSASQLAHDWINGNPKASGDAGGDFSLRRDIGGRHYLRSLDSLNCRLDMTNSRSSGRMNSSKPLTSFLTHVGGFLRRSKTKDSASHEVAEL